MKKPRRTWLWLLLLAASLGVGWVLQQAALPAALMLGPMLCAIAFGVSGSDLKLPRWAFFGAQSVIGCLVARALSASILIEIADDWAVMLLIVSTTVMAGALVGWVLVKFGALPGTTAAWGSSPGAASAMVVMAEEFGADPRLVGFMQYLRVVIVVMSASLAGRLLLGHDVPQTSGPALFEAAPLLPLAETLAIALVGAMAGRFLRIPAGGMLLPMIIGAVLHTTGLLEITLPPWLLAISYLALGWYIGLGFTRSILMYALRALPQLLLSIFLLIGLCGLSAWLLHWFLHTDGLTAYLATSPGGLDSVAIIAIGSGANTPFVLAVQTLRLFIVLLTGPQIAKLISRYA
ncbi:AbrB family transcriptional regulator [Telmatospirillum sp.]|uniref:AbrB family transcriptional regulator n=1 Tax=Telmatospirillum sp. TaxID=2079197 RepID=UPI002842B0B1|nr:AbrB family transcriptional regulator [Telmatospirillum sp.]MDR3441109.1 AbrB family transcriptional regulator [Telmatospirillum sp.]